MRSRGPMPKRVACNITVDSLDAQVAKFWELEEVPSVKHISDAERACEEHFSRTYFRDQNGRYVVRLPFNDKKHNLGDSLQGAKKRLHSLERRLIQDLQMREEYSNFLSDYENLGHMTEVPDSDITEDGYFIPHHPVFKRDSQTTKLRVVFYASSKTTSGFSLNDTLLTGPIIQKDLFMVITKFRTHRYVLTADIEKMYRQIKLNHEDIKYQRILWRKFQDELVKTTKHVNLWHRSCIISGSSSFEAIS